MIDLNNILIEDMTQQTSENWPTPKGVLGRIVINCNDVDHARLLKKQVLYCKRVERDLVGYIRILDTAGHDIADKSPKFLAKELTDLLEDRLFEDAHIEDECNE